MKHRNFQLVPHTADLRLRVHADSLEELFKYALIGMFQSIGPESSACQKKDGLLVCTELAMQRSVNIKSYNHDQLLIDFLNEALYLSDVHNEAYLDADIGQLSDTQINATIKGIKIDRFEIVEIKAVTHHGGSIQKLDDGWTVDIVIDI